MSLEAGVSTSEESFALKLASLPHPKENKEEMQRKKLA